MKEKFLELDSVHPLRSLNVLGSHTMQLEAYLAEYNNALRMVECTTTSKTSGASELELKNRLYKTDFALTLGKTLVYIQKFMVKKVPLAFH